MNHHIKLKPGDVAYIERPPANPVKIWYDKAKADILIAEIEPQDVPVLNTATGKYAETKAQHAADIKAACGPMGEVFNTGPLDDIPFFNDRDEPHGD